MGEKKLIALPEKMAFSEKHTTRAQVRYRSANVKLIFAKRTLRVTELLDTVRYGNMINENVKFSPAAPFIYHSS